MRWIQAVLLRMRAAFQRTRVEREMEAELTEHLESETAELMARGLPPADARRRARATMGRMDAIKEGCRDSRGTAQWEQLKQDVIFGLRLLGKNRTFSSIALATMALGIGSTTAVFSVVDRVLIRPLPFAAPERLFHASDVGTRAPFDILRANSRLADYAGHLGVRRFSVMGLDGLARLRGTEVSANFFQVLGAGPLLGRTFAEGEDRPGRTRVAILSHSFWEQRYGSRPDAIGRQITLDEAAYEIVGVMPAWFQYPAATVNFWVPMRLDPRALGDYWGTGGISVFARLRPGVQPEAAASELRAWIPRIRAMFPWLMPDAWGTEAGLMALQEHLVKDAKVRSLLLLAVVALVLLIATVNVANLMIGQAAARQRELTLRASLGATPGRLARQLLTEAIMLAVIGGVLGVMLAFGQLSLLKHLLPADTPRLAEVAIDRRILAFTAAISLGSGLFCGLLPAWRARKQRSLATIESGRATVSAMSLRTDAGLVMTEAVFATILLVGAGLLLRTLWTMLQVDPGFRPESLVTAYISPNRAATASIEKVVALYEQVRVPLVAYPGVRSVAAMDILPLTPAISAVSSAIEDHPRPPHEPQFVLWSTIVTPEHLETLGIRLLAGRGFTAADRQGAEGVVLISQRTARRFWPDINPIGRRLRPVSATEWRIIIGVVEDVKNFGIAGTPGWVDGDIYVPLAQAMYAPRTISLIARLDGDTASFERRLPAMIREVCPNCAVGSVARMETILADATEKPRSLAWLMGSFAVLALGLSAAGIYGVVSHGVLRRTREVGVRLALGASRGSIAWLIIRSSLLFTLMGTVVGVFISLSLARLIETLLFGVTAHDPISFTIAPTLLVTAAIFATLSPMYRAMRIDPAQSLREG